MREHRPSESRRKRRHFSHTSVFLHFTRLSILRYYYYSHYSKTFALPLSLFLSNSSLTSRSTSSLLFFAFNSSSSSLFFDKSIRLIAWMVFAFSSVDSFLKTSAFNRSCLASLSRRDVENTTAENPIKNVDATKSFCQFSAFENLGLLISLLYLWGSKRIGNSSLLLLFEVSFFLFRRSVTQRERESKKAPHGKRERDREHISSRVCCSYRRREREKEKSIGH